MFPKYEGILAEAEFTRTWQGYTLKGFLIKRGSEVINPPQEITIKNIKHLSLDLGLVETTNNTLYTIRTYRGTGKIPPEGLKNIPEEKQ
jgi:hypothetical protein